MYVKQPANSNFSKHYFEFLSHLGFIFLNHGKFDKSADIYNFLDYLSPSDFRIVFPLTYSLIQEGFPDIAIEKLNCLKGTKDADPVFWFLRAQAFYQLGLPAEACKAMRTSIRLRNINLQKGPILWR